MTKLQLSGGEVIQIELRLEELREALQAALAENRLLELNAPDGRSVVINPHQVQYLQGVDPEAEPSTLNGAAAAAPAAAPPGPAR